ncbi:alpha/beta hydrolase [Spongiivirga sp. MCCC 1A20706]|uniref:alpha/beta fold hydrolase n=1 Tax=Spongiivirga sp. MCCC 1A20706 TaxID=3160963 RepID=UPI003977C8D2
MPELQDKYVQLDGRKLHFYIGGSGPALVLMHPSPHTGEMLIPIAKELTSHYTVLCIDTPGYGKSDGFEIAPTSIEQYTDLLYQFFKKMGLQKPSLYGSATGAQIAIRYAINYPDDVGHIFLDNSAHFDDALRSEIMKYYFPDLTPVENGDHLKTIWRIVSNMFQYFPWCLQTDEFKLDRSQLPKEFLHAIAIDYLKAGATYHYAYKVAFEHEIGSNVQEIKAPTTIFNWTGSIIRPYVDALLAFEFGSNIETLTLPADQNERMEIMCSHINKKTNGAPFYLSEVVTITPENDHEPYIPISVVPSITMDGDYLLDAWNNIKKEKPSLSPTEIQDSMVSWFSNANA